MHFKAENLLFPTMYCEDAWWFTYESQKTMTKFAIQVFFLQNALVEYIGVYSDTNKCDEPLTLFSAYTNLGDP